MLRVFKCIEIWQTSLQQRFRYACQISNWFEYFNTQYCVFETLQNRIRYRNGFPRAVGVGARSLAQRHLVNKWELHLRQHSTWYILSLVNSKSAPSSCVNSVNRESLRSHWRLMHLRDANLQTKKIDNIAVYWVTFFKSKLNKQK